MRDRICSATKLKATEANAGAGATSGKGKHHSSGTMAGDALDPEKASTESPVMTLVPMHSRRKPMPPMYKLWSSECVILILRFLIAGAVDTDRGDALRIS